MRGVRKVGSDRGNKERRGQGSEGVMVGGAG